MLQTQGIFAFPPPASTLLLWVFQRSRQPEREFVGRMFIKCPLDQTYKREEKKP